MTRIVRRGMPATGRVSLVALVTGIACTSCGEPEPARQYRLTVDTALSGFPTIHHSEFASVSADWTIVEDLRIGSVDGDEPTVFSEIVTFLIDRDKWLYILDQMSQEIRVFDSGGSFRFAFGREGSGPGELRSAAGLAWSSHQTVWVSDFRNQRYSEFARSGQLLGTWPGRVPIFAFGGTIGGVDDDGSLYEEVVAGDPQKYAHFVRRLDPRTGRADSVVLTNVRAAPGYKVDRVELPVPFEWEFVWRADDRGRIWTARTDEYALLCRTVAGDTVLRIVTDLRPNLVTPEERRLRISGLEDLIRQVGGRGSLDYSRIPDVHPLLESFDVDDHGRVWVRRVTRDRLVRFDVFSMNGQFIMAVDGPWSVPRQWPVRIAGNSVAALVKDSLGVSYIVRGSLQRKVGAHQ